MQLDVAFSAEQVAAIVAKASTLDERLNEVCMPTASDDGLIQRRLDQWCERAAKGDTALFEELLALRGIDMERAKCALSGVIATNGHSAPQWTELLCAGVAAAPNAGACAYCDAEYPLPFEQIAVPFVEAATAILRERAGSEWLGLADAVRMATQRTLLAWVSNICAPALMLEFSIYRLRRANGNAQSNQRYRDFVTEMLQGRLVQFFTEYSVLARAVGTVMENWISATAEFLDRLAADREELERLFGDGKELGQLTDVRTGLSDPHHSGRTVMGLQFASGIRVIYKPKSLETESAYGELLDWMNGHGLSLPLRATRVVLRRGYGWVEYLKHTPCAGDDELSRFYRRSGMLLALFRLLSATDMHHDNLIAVGEHPMIVDTETLITPPLRAKQPDSITGLLRAEFKLEDSIVLSRMLPSWRSEKNGSCYDMSGLGGVGGEEVTVAVWESTHMDDVSRRRESTTLAANRNVPFPPGSPAVPPRFIEDIVAGFREAYRILMQHASELTRDDSALRRLAASPMRLIFRDTQTYFTLLKNSLEPDLVRDGVDRSINLEALCRILLVTSPRTRHLPIVETEKRSLEALDIPAFTLVPDSRALLSGGRSISDEFFPECGFNKVLETVRKLSDVDCEEQVDVIRGTFYAKALNQGVRLVGAGSKAGSVQDCPPPIQIARELARRVFRGDDGSCMWVGLSFQPSMPGHNYGSLPAGLFSGLAGVAIFLAAVERVTGDSSFRELAYGALRTIQQSIAAVRAKTKWNRSTDRDMEIALLAYPLVKCAELLDDAALIESARETTDLVVSALSNERRIAGVHFGAPGVLLGLLALHERQPDDAILKLARACGDHVAKRTDSSPGRELALARLHGCVGEAEAWQPWIEGAAGQALAALARGGDVDVDAIAAMPLTGSDSIWDGTFGRVALLIDAGNIDAARDLATAAVNRASQAGDFFCHDLLPPNAFVPGFYQGLSGIGYELLRLSSPEKLPSLVLWQ